MSTDPTDGGMPVAGPARVRAHARGLLRRHRRGLTVVLGWHACATTAGLVAPWLVGMLVDTATGATGAGAGAATGPGRDAALLTVGHLGAGLLAALTVQAVLLHAAVRRAYRLGEQVTAEVREQVVDRFLHLPLDTVEAAPPGELLTRASRDTDALADTVRYAVPEVAVALLSCVLTVLALLVLNPWTVLPSLVVVPLLTLSTRWYLRRSPPAYQRRSAAYVDLSDTVAETVPSARTVEVFGLHRWRRQELDCDLATAWAAERHAVRLRSTWYLVVEFSYVVPVVATLLVGGLLLSSGLATLGEVVAAVLYVRALIFPLDDVLNWADELQVGVASLGRVLGVTELGGPVGDRSAPPHHVDDQQVDDQVTARGVRYAYRPGHDVLCGIDLDLRPGERVVVVGPSGSGKSTLGRVLAGVTAPTSGMVRLSGIDPGTLDSPALRRRVALVAQEQHVFRGTLRDNVTMVAPGAADTEVDAALIAVGAHGWVSGLPAGLDTVVGADGQVLDAGAAQQVALARVVLAAPAAVVLDEATAALAPAAARAAERGVAAALPATAIMIITHRLAAARDADRVAVLVDGRISELGRHGDLIDADGPYAALWRARAGG